MKKEERLQDRFTKEQREKAEAISNDIAEDIDNHDSKKDLRMAVDYWSSVAADTAIELNLKHFDEVIEELKKLNKHLDDQLGT